MKPIYEPKGKAKEYGDFAINIYTGCPHKCYYCFAPNVLHRTKEAFHNCVELRKGIVEAVKRQLDADKITDKLIHLCFVCDPYPVGYDSTPTREIIKAIKESGNHVQILTKGGKMAERDFDLLDSKDRFGVTVSTFDGHLPEPFAAPVSDRLYTLFSAKQKGIFTWVSCEPVLDEESIYQLISTIDTIDLYKIGKLNYHPSGINWKEFGQECERLCKLYNRNYYIKDGLRKEMEDI